MHNIESTFFFIFVFTILIVFRNLFRIISTLLDKEPKKIVYTNRELIILGLSLSYIITFIKFT